MLVLVGVPGERAQQGWTSGQGRFCGRRGTLKAEHSSSVCEIPNVVVLGVFLLRLFCLPWWSSSKNPPYKAGDAGSIPGQGAKIPHATGQLSPRATTTELACRKLQSPRALEPARHN